MASSEGQTELLSGWSCVVHQPSEDPEPSELPSTVDITAFSAGLNVEPVGNAAAASHASSDSDSDSESASHGSGSGSGSCSASDSSDSDSSSSSTSSRSRSPSPEFSVTSQSPGLRMTIASVRKIGNDLPSPCPSADLKGKNLSESSDSEDSSDSDSSASSVEVKNGKSSLVTKSVTTANAATNNASANSTRANQSNPAGSNASANSAANAEGNNKEKPAPPPTRASRLRRAPPPVSEKSDRTERTERRVERRNVRNAKEVKDSKDKDVSPRVLRERARLKRKKVSLPSSYDNDKYRRIKRRSGKDCGDECFFAVHVAILVFFVGVCYLLKYFHAV